LGSKKIDCTDDCDVYHDKTCYCTGAKCSDLSDLTTWTEDSCTGDNCRIYNGDVPIPNYYEPSCPSQQQKTCYVHDNRKPLPPTSGDVIIEPGDWTSVMAQTDTVKKSTTLSRILKLFVPETNAQTPTQEILGFTTDTYSGKVISNPVKVTATYKDLDGSNDILALYLWFTKDGPTFQRPEDINNNLTPKTNNDSNFGFMIYRPTETDPWNVYIPSLSGTTKGWKNIGNITDALDIKGYNGNNMVTIYDLELNNSSTTEITMTLYMQYLYSQDTLESGQYQVWGLVDDKVSWINDDVSWTNSGTTWNIDVIDPNSAQIDIVTDNYDEIGNLNQGNLSIDLSAQDDNELGPIRLDACRTGGTQTDRIYIEGSRDYELKDCDTLNFGGNPPEDVHMDQGYSIISNSVVNPTTANYTENILISLGENEGGSITFYFTVMDEGGNWIQTPKIYRLGEWAAVQNGLVFGSEGVTSATRVFQDDTVWNSDGYPGGNKLEEYGFTESTIDLTDTLLLGGSSTYTSFIGFLERYGDNNSFKAARYPGARIGTPYVELIEALHYKQPTLDIENESTVYGNISDICNDPTQKYCIIANTGNLTIDQNTVCDKNGLIASAQNITITPDFLNQNDTNACIILANGNITITGGDNLTGDVNYDTIEAFMIAGGQIIIEEETGSDVHDGLRVEGGLTAFTKGSAYGSIQNERIMEQISIRNAYPILAIKSSAKYGILSRALFGSQIDIFKTEVGFKPY
jgi:hypothetical protein